MLGAEGEDFQEWFQEYTALDGNDFSKDASVIRAVETDELDTNTVEQLIQESTTQVPVTKGFCTKCQGLFDNWPTIGGSSTRKHDSKPDPHPPGGGWEYTMARPCSTFELESSTRSGCRLCAFLLQSLKDIELLDTFRKIEVRLFFLGEKATASLSIQNWGTNPIQLLWINSPGKECTHCNSGIAIETKVESRFLPVSADYYDDPRNVLDIASN